MPDALTATATQVRIPGGVAHQLVADSQHPDEVRVYLTGCGWRLMGEQGAMLTTREPECGLCALAGLDVLAAPS